MTSGMGNQMGHEGQKPRGGKGSRFVRCVLGAMLFSLMAGLLWLVEEAKRIPPPAPRKTMDVVGPAKVARTDANRRLEVAEPVPAEPTVGGDGLVPVPPERALSVIEWAPPPHAMGKSAEVLAMPHTGPMPDPFAPPPEAQNPYRESRSDPIVAAWR